MIDLQSWTGGRHGEASARWSQRHQLGPAGVRQFQQAPAQQDASIPRSEHSAGLSGWLPAGYVSRMITPSPGARRSGFRFRGGAGWLAAVLVDSTICEPAGSR